MHPGKSLTAKLLAGSTVVLLLVFLIFGVVSTYGLTHLSSEFSLLNRDRGTEVRGILEKVFHEHLSKIQQIYGSALEARGKRLLLKDREALRTMVEDNAFMALREYLKRSFRDDAEIVQASYIVIEGKEVRAWQHVSRANPSGLPMPIEYDRAHKSWVAGQGDSSRLRVYDPEVLNIASITEPTVTAKKMNLSSAGVSGEEVPAYDCIVPIYQRTSSPEVVKRAISQGEPVGYLRYVLTTAEMEAAVSAEKKSEQNALKSLEQQNANTDLQSERIVRKSLRDAMFLLFMGSVVALLGSGFLLWAVSRRFILPIKELTRVAQSMAAGDYKQSIAVRSQDEVGVLAQAFNELSEAINKRDRELAEINKNLESLVVERTRQLAEEVRTVSNLLNNMKQAVFVADRNATVIPPVSLYSQKVFGFDINGLSVFDTLYSAIDRKSEAHSLLNTAWLTVFGEDDLQWTLMEDNFPKQTRLIQKNGDERVLKIAYVPLRDETGAMDYLMFVVEDVTEVLALEQRIKVERATSARNMQQIQEMLNADAEALREFFAHAHKLITESLDQAHLITADSKNLEAIQRNVHTLKGNARVLSLTGLAGEIHKIESDLTEARNQMKPGIAAETIARNVLTSLTAVQSLLQDYARIAKKVFRVEDEFEIDLISDFHSLVAEFDAFLLQTVEDKDQLIIDVEKSKQFNSREWREIQTRLFTSIARLTELLPLLMKTAKGLGEQQCVEILEKMLLSVARYADIDAITVNAVRQQLLLPWSQVRKVAIRSYVKSSLYRPYRTSPELWVPVFVATYHAWRDYQSYAKASLGEALETARNTLELTLHHFGSICAREKLIYLSSLSQQALVLLQMTGTQGALRGVFAAIWHYLCFVSYINSHETMPQRYRKRFLEVLQKMPADVQQCRTYLEKQGGYNTLLLSVLRSLSRSGEHPTKFFEVASEAMGKKVTETTFVSVDANSAVEAPTIMMDCRDAQFADGPTAALLRQAENPATLSSRFVPAYDTEGAGHFWYVKSIDFSALIEGYEYGRSAASINDSSIRTMEVVETHFNAMRQYLNDLTAEGKSPDLPTLRKNFTRLLNSPVKPSLLKYYQMVKDLARQLSKRVQFRITGDDITINRDHLYVVHDILLQLIRNSLDHGIETPDERKALGKPDEGFIEVHCAQEGDRIELRLRDDGRGIDVDRVAQKAVELKRVTREELEKMSWEQKSELILLSGVSTKFYVSEISGRGVGMDIVKSKIDKIGGKLQLNTEPGVGTEFVITFEY